MAVPASFIGILSGLRDGDSAAADFMDDVLSWCGLELHSRETVGSAKCRWVVDFADDFPSEEGFLSELDCKLRFVNAMQTLLTDWLESGRPTLAYSFRSSLGDMWLSFLEEPSEASIPSYAVVVSAVVLLSLVYQYLTGNVDRGGSKAYSRSSLDFRDVYVAIVLFLGAYVWIKFREAAPAGVHRRKLRGTKVVYDARLTPPTWNGRKVPRLELGRFATPQEAHNKFLIAAFYYNRYAGLLDGWFQVPSMSEEERSLTGEEKMKWVKGQAKEVYKAFEKKKVERKEKEEATLLPQELLKGCEVQAIPGHDEVNVDPCGTSFLNSAEPQQLVHVSQVENSGMGMVMPDNHGLECASPSFDGTHEGLALSNGHSLGSQEGSALPISQLPPNTESGMSLNGNDQLDLLHTRVGTQQQQICLQQQQISDQQQQISLQQWQIQELATQFLELQHQQRILQQQLQESRIQNPQSPCQFCFQQQQLQDINQGLPSFEAEMEEQSMHQHNYPGLMALPPDGGEVQEASWELDALKNM